MIRTRAFSTRLVNLATPPPAAPLRLNNIADNPGARKKQVRLGRGRGSGCGKTSGRGQKGQRARNSVRLGFEGGQTPLQKRIPKRYTFDPFARPLVPLPLSRIQRFVDIGRLDSDRQITMRELVRSGCVQYPEHGVILTDGRLFGSKMDLQVTYATPEAARNIIRHGGAVSLVWYNRLGLRALIKPEKWLDRGLPLPRWARPPPKWEHRFPERTSNGVPVRTVSSEDDIKSITEAWKRVVHLRDEKARF